MHRAANGPRYSATRFGRNGFARESAFTGRTVPPYTFGERPICPFGRRGRHNVASESRQEIRVRNAPWITDSDRGKSIAQTHVPLRAACFGQHSAFRVHYRQLYWTLDARLQCRHGASTKSPRN